MKNFEQVRNTLIAVDVQNDFIDGSLAIEQGGHVVDPINLVAAAVRRSNGQVALTRDWHPITTPHFETWPSHCVAGTEGAEFHANLEIESTDIIISKGMEQTDGYSGWEGVSQDGETLESLISPNHDLERVRVFIGGLATDYCVKATALDIAERFKDDERIQLYLIRDAVRAVGLGPDDEVLALEAMKQAKYHAVSSQEAKAIIEQGLL